MYLSDAILKADGLMPTAFLERAEIIRKNDDFTDSLITVNLEKVMQKDKSQNLKLKEGDLIVTIYNADDLLFNNDLFITGHVKVLDKKTF